jgi:hypothetical protein
MRPARDKAANPHRYRTLSLRVAGPTSAARVMGRHGGAVLPVCSSSGLGRGDLDSMSSLVDHGG